MTFTFARTDANDAVFRRLVVELDNELAVRDGDAHTFYVQFNELNDINHVVVAWQDDVVVGCGAFKFYEGGGVEIKRMYVPPSHRKLGIARRVLVELERWARELGHTWCVLETGKNQPEAIALYNSCGYQRTPNYGQYAGVELSVCFEKYL